MFHMRYDLEIKRDEPIRPQLARNAVRLILLWIAVWAVLSVALSATHADTINLNLEPLPAAGESQ